MAQKNSPLFMIEFNALSVAASFFVIPLERTSLIIDGEVQRFPYARSFERGKAVAPILGLPF